jgi:sporulation related protein
MGGGLQRVVIGGLGGLAAICAKYVAQDHDFIQDLSSFHDPRLYKILFGYCILTPILIFLGGLLAWVSYETQPLKLLAMGVAAPALITTMAGGAKTKIPESPSLPRADLLSPIGSAHAAPFPRIDAAPNVVTLAQASSIQQGVELFFGVQRYWVIVGSFKDKSEAEAMAARINASGGSLRAFAGKRQPNNEFYPVIVGDYVPLAEANQLREAAFKLPGVREAYLSAYPDRRP